jgi:hypothetical protein
MLRTAFVALAVLVLIMAACQQAPAPDDLSVRGAVAAAYATPQTGVVRVVPAQVVALVGRGFAPMPTDNQVMGLRTDAQTGRALATEHIQIRAVRVSHTQDSLYLYIPAEMPEGIYTLFLTARGQTLSHYEGPARPIRIAVVRQSL